MNYNDLVYKDVEELFYHGLKGLLEKGGLPVSQEVQGLAATKLFLYFKEKAEEFPIERLMEIQESVIGRMQWTTEMMAIATYTGLKEQIDKFDFYKNKKSLLGCRIDFEIMKLIIQYKNTEDFYKSMLSSIANGIQQVGTMEIAYSSGIVLGMLMREFGIDQSTLENLLIGKGYETKQIAGIIAIDYLWPSLKYLKYV